MTSVSVKIGIYYTTEDDMVVVMVAAIALPFPDCFKKGVGSTLKFAAKVVYSAFNHTLRIRGHDLLLRQVLMISKILMRCRLLGQCSQRICSHLETHFRPPYDCNL